MLGDSDFTERLSCLIADDDQTLSALLADRLSRSFPRIDFHVEYDVQKLFQAVQNNEYQLAVLDINFGPGLETLGLELAKKLLGKNPKARIIVLTGQKDKNLGWACLKEGVQHFINKPFDFEHLVILFHEAINQWSIRYHATLTDRLVSSSFFFGESEAGRKLKDQTLFCASNDLPVLIVGESGTGKSTLARLIHDLSRRSRQKFSVFHPGLTSEELVYTELFGAKKGAYTGLNVDRRGLVSNSNGGTLFIDEITELPLTSQTMLLKVLQDRRFRPLGSDNEEVSDFRLISATNQDVVAKINEKKFREDLYYRVAGIVLRTPNLNEIRSDLHHLIEALLSQIARDSDGGQIPISEEAIVTLSNRDFPGNIRQLRYTLERAYHRALFEGASSITVRHVQEQEHSEVDTSLHLQVDQFRKSLIEQALRKTGFNQVKAAEVLKIDRNQLRRYMQRYGLVPQHPKHSL